MRWKALLVVVGIATSSSASAQVGPVDCLSVAINWMNYIAPLAASSISKEELAEAKQNLLEVRPDMPDDLGHAVDRLIEANEDLATNPRNWEDPSHPLNTGETEEIFGLYEKAMPEACPDAA